MTVVILSIMVPFSALIAQPQVGQSVPDVTETACDGATERIHDILAQGKPLLVFRTDMVCSVSVPEGIALREEAVQYADAFRTWVAADFEEANDEFEQCLFMALYEEQTGMGIPEVFRFIHEGPMGPYDPGYRGASGERCFIGYVVIGLDSTISYVGMSLTEAVEAALLATSIQHLQGTSGGFTVRQDAGLLEIHATHSEVFGLQLFSTDGRLIKRTTMHGPVHRMDISGLPSGSYVMRIEDRLGRPHSLRFTHW
jgi:hypothetical protein